MSRPLVVLEFNELCPGLLDRFISEGQLPAFARLQAQSVVAITDAQEEPQNLEPWIQWVTVHTGLSYEKHGVRDLGDGPKLDAPRLWDMASDEGKKVWICGSMNAGMRGGKVNGWILPDPWSIGVEPYPKSELNPFYHLVRSYVQEYTNAKVPLTKLDYARFAAFMVKRGLSAGTVAQTLAQLASETSGKNRWKRAMILDRLQWDVFRWYWQAHRPAYSTMFLNSTAHVQHYHWRNFEPSAFSIQPSAEEQSEFADAMRVAYRAMDRIVNEAMRMAPDATIVFMTGLSQQPLVKYEGSGGKQVFRVRDPGALMSFAGVADRYHYAPVMAEEFHLLFDSPEAAARAQVRLGAMHVDGQAAMKMRLEANGLFCGCDIIVPPADGALLASRLSDRTSRFHDQFYLLGGLKSGGHHPDGAFWVYRAGAQRRDVQGKVPLRQTTPTLAALMGLKDAHSRFEMPPLPEVLELLGAPRPVARREATVSAA